MNIVVRDQSVWTYGERPICVDIVVRDQSMWILQGETNLCGYCGERLFCVDIVVRD